MLWLFLSFPRLTLDTYQHLSAQPHNTRPAVVYDSTNNVILQCCLQAEQCGIEPSMGMAQAASLCPDLNILDYREKLETQRLENIAMHLYQIAADIALFPPKALAIRLDTLKRYYGDYQTLWASIKHSIEKLHIGYHFATGWSIEAAQVLSTVPLNCLLTDKQEIAHRLRQLSTQQLNVTEKQKQAMHRTGLRQLGQLLALPLTELGKRFDNRLIQYLAAVKGEVFPQVTYFHPTAAFNKTLELNYDIEDSTKLLPWISILLDELMVYLRLRNQTSTALKLTLIHHEVDTVSLTIRSSALMSRTKQWLMLIQLKLESQELVAPVRQLKLEALSVEPLNSQTDDFFEDRHHYFARQQLIGKLVARLGENALSHPSFPHDHRFESHHAESKNDSSFYPGFPAFYLHQPQPLTQSPVIEYGPLRIQGGWWDNRKVKRDYFIARTPQGQRIQIFRENEGWFLQGWYS